MNDSNMNSNDNNSKPNPERYIFDTYLIKEFLDTVKDGNIEKIKNYIGNSQREYHKLPLL